MKAAVDTNVLIRYLVGDHPKQAELASAALDEYQTLVIPTVVLCELVWVLRRVFGVDRAGQLRVLGEVLARSSVEVDRPTVAAGLAMLEAGGDFADGCLLHDAERQRCETVVTFDKRFAARAGDRARLLAS